MADFTSVPTVELLTRAADAAEKAATAAEYVATWYQRAELEREGFQPGEACLVAASGPDHWRAVEGTFRSMLALHPNTTDDDGWRVCATCVNLGEPDNWPCSTLEALRPLAEQVLRDLGGS